MKTLIVASSLAVILSAGNAFAFGAPANARLNAAPTAETSVQIVQVGMGVKNRSNSFRTSSFTNAQGSTTQQASCALCTGLGGSLAGVLNVGLDLGLFSSSSSTTSYSHQSGSQTQIINNNNRRGHGRR